MRSALVLLALVSAAALARPTAAQDTQAATRPEAPVATLPEAPPHLQLVRQGDDAYLAGDHQGAISFYLRALSADPAPPIGHCRLAAARRAAGEIDDALEDYRACQRAARTAGRPLYEAAALTGLAQTLQQVGRREEAREAWRALVSFAEAYPGVVSIEFARGRLTAHDTITELDAVANDVRILREQDAANATE